MKFGKPVSSELRIGMLYLAQSAIKIKEERQNFYYLS